MKILLIWFTVLVSTAVLLVGCSRQAELAQGWTPVCKVTDSREGLNDPLYLYKWHNKIIALRGYDDWSARCFLMNSNASTWTEVPITGVPRGYVWYYPAIDQAGDGVFFQQGYMEDDQLVLNLLVGRLTGSVAVLDATERKSTTNKKSLFGETGPNVRLNESGRNKWPSLGLGLMNGQDLYVPCCLRGETYHGKTVFEDEGPFNNGVSHSADSGMTWQMEKISDFDAWLPSICTTKAYCYYLAVKNFQRDLWFACKPVEGGSWTAPEVVTKTFCDSASYWKYVAVAEGDTVHVCWLDRRHEKMRVNLQYPYRRNYEVAYCHRKDSDADWNKNIILSKGLLYSYSPSMSVEGDKIVIAWAGVQTAPDWHNESSPNDIYYVTSKDGGETWAKPLRVTDNIKNGVTAGRPQVALLNGVVRLFFIQGKMNLQQISPGLTKLNQPPWPIYYQQRPFPD